MRNIIIAAILPIIIVVYLCILSLSSILSNQVLDSTITIAQPNYKESLYSIMNEKNNSDFLLAILGTDERNNEKSRSDVIILVKFKVKENKAIIVSIPRDSKVFIPNKGLNKINAAAAFGGPKLQVDVLENLFKINNVRYIHLNFEGFKEIIDSIGGIEINAQKDFKRDWGEKATFAKKGKNVLFGNDLLDYVRFRHDEEGDFGRIKRQQEVIFSLASSTLNPANITKLPEIALVIAKNSESDMDIFFIMKHIEKIKRLKLLEFEFYTLETSSEKSNGIWYEIIDEENLKLISDLLQE